jgi:hypothetical protein
VTDEREETVPNGYRWLIVMATIFKRTLAQDPMTAAQRLEMLEALHAMTDQFFTPVALAALEPADSITVSILREAWRLDGDTDDQSFAVLTSPEVFRNLLAANRSIAAAIALCAGRHRPSAPPAAASPDAPPQAPSPTAASVNYRDPRLEPTPAPTRAGGIDFDLF